MAESGEATICIRENEALAETLAACQAAEAKAETLAPQRERLMKERAALAQKVGIASQEAEEIKSRIPAEVSSAAGLRAILGAHRKTSTNYVTRRGEIKAKLDTIAEAEKQTASLRKDVELSLIHI